MSIGLHPRMSFEQYKAVEAVNFSSLKEMARSARHYRHYLEAPKSTTPSMSLGSAAHTAILEPHEFLRRYALWDERNEEGNVRPRRGKLWDQFLADNEGKECIRAEEYYLAMAMRDAVRSHPDALRYLRIGQPEVSMVWGDPETQTTCKGRADWITYVDGADVLVGLKTTRDCRMSLFATAAARLGYPMQWALYRDIYEGITGRVARVVEVVVESNAPHDVAVYIIPAEVIEAGREQYTDLLAQLRTCETSGTWPGAMPGEVPLQMPAWYFGSDAENDFVGELGLEA